MHLFVQLHPHLVWSICIHFHDCVGKVCCLFCCSHTCRYRALYQYMLHRVVVYVQISHLSPTDIKSDTITQFDRHPGRFILR